MVQVGFEPTPPKRLELESSALDRSATEPISLSSSPSATQKQHLLEKDLLLFIRTVMVWMTPWPSG